MKKQNESSDILVGGILGYFLGKSSQQELPPFLKDCQKRWNLLTGFKIFPPTAFLDKKNGLTTLYREAINCYFYGLPNSCIPSIVRILEIALTTKYEEVELRIRPKNVDLSGLINWAEEFQKDDKKIAHSFRRVRNFIHDETLVEIQDALESIRHISLIISKLYPNYVMNISTTCSTCNTKQDYIVLPDLAFFGNLFDVTCIKCRKPYRLAFALPKKTI